LKHFPAVAFGVFDVLNASTISFAAMASEVATFFFCAATKITKAAK
jgi:hypothetical protein